MEEQRQEDMERIVGNLTVMNACLRDTAEALGGLNRHIDGGRQPVGLLHISHATDRRCNGEYTRYERLIHDACVWEKTDHALWIFREATGRWAVTDEPQGMEGDSAQVLAASTDTGAAAPHEVLAWLEPQAGSLVASPLSAVAVTSPLLPEAPARALPPFHPPADALQGTPRRDPAERGCAASQPQGKRSSLSSQTASPPAATVAGMGSPASHGTGSPLPASASPKARRRPQLPSGQQSTSPPRMRAAPSPPSARMWLSPQWCKNRPEGRVD